MISFIELDLELQSNVEIVSVSKRFKQENQKVEISKNECFDYLSEVLLDYVPEFILSKDNYVSLILV